MGFCSKSESECEKLTLSFDVAPGGNWLLASFRIHPVAIAIGDIQLLTFPYGLLRVALEDPWGNVQLGREDNVRCTQVGNYLFKPDREPHDIKCSYGWTFRLDSFHTWSPLSLSVPRESFEDACLYFCAFPLEFSPLDSIDQPSQH